MCMAAWIWQAHPVHQLLLLLNMSSKTCTLGWRGEGSKKILGARDVLGGRTWMGCTKDGGLAFLTKVLEPDAIPGARTRGDLHLRYLQVHSKATSKASSRSLELIEAFIRLLS
ncbi:hypothetical protein HU200_058428 [Digitaria exilis]|uniref:Uncharacterized protein n=1 Tax=Digitaria exilis TaxID=1010633 RepID=A0A835ADP3_9POAL|nr:hypothetical protein HU200_058428 [Digitaria exilis]